MPVFHPNGAVVKTIPAVAAERGFGRSLVTFFTVLSEAFREAREMQKAAYRRGSLINR